MQAVPKGNCANGEHEWITTGDYDPGRCRHCGLDKIDVLTRQDAPLTSPPQARLRLTGVEVSPAAVEINGRMFLPREVVEAALSKDYPSSWQIYLRRQILDGLFAPVV